MKKFVTALFTTSPLPYFFWTTYAVHSININLIHLLKKALIKQKKKFAGGRKNVSQREGQFVALYTLKNHHFWKIKKVKMVETRESPKKQ